MTLSRRETKDIQLADGETVSQPELLEADKDWEEMWRGMPAYEQTTKMLPWQAMTVYFAHPKDREEFAKLVNQNISIKTKMIWYPKAEIMHAANKRYTAEKVTPRYPVYIISKGRWEQRLTAKAFEMMGVPYHIVVEPQEYANYAAVIDPKKILTLPFSNLGLGGIPARNWVWEHALTTGAERHWIFDDNIWGFCRFNNNLKVEVDSGVTLCAVEDFVDRYENFALAGFHYDYFAAAKEGTKIRPFILNTRIYSGILIKNDLPHRWRGRYNEDTDLSIRVLEDGWCTVLFNAFLMYKAPTLTMKGGNTDELYRGVEVTAKEWAMHVTSCTAGCKVDENPCCDAGREILKKDGRWLMAESLREQHPDITRVTRKWSRWQHTVDYRRFKNNTPVLRAGVTLPTEPNEYGMSLTIIDEDVAPAAQLKVAKTVEKQVRTAKTPKVELAVAGAGPSIFDFLTEAAAAPPPAPAPPVEETPAPVQVVAPAEPSVQIQPVSAPVPEEASAPAPVTAEPAGAGEPSAFDTFYASFLERGHRALTTDGKLFVTNSLQLTVADRAMIKEHREKLLAIAVENEAVKKVLVQQQYAKAVDESFTPTPEPEVEPTLPNVVMGQPSLSAFLSTAGHENWRPDTPPDLTGIDEVVLNFSTTGLDWAKGARPCGVTVATLDGKMTRFLPFAFEGGGNLDEATMKQWAERELRNKKITNANTRFDVHESRVWGVDLIEQGCTFSDIQHTAALLDDHRKQFRLDALAKDYLPELEKVDRVDEKEHSQHHAADVAEREKFTADLVWRLRDVLYPQLKEQGLEAVQDLEDGVIPCVVEMEKNGSPIDVALNEQFYNECNAKHEQLLREVSAEAGFAFDHTAKSWQRLFEKLGLPPTDGNAENVLKGIDHPLVRKGHLASQYASLNSKTFAAYRELVGADGILRFSINQLRSDDGGTVSGRFSIGYVQQVPNHDNHHATFGNVNILTDDCEHGKCNLYPRRVFIPGEGDYLEADAAQIEYRLLAHYAENQQIIQAYRDNPDLSFHKLTWEMIKQYKPDMLYSHQKSFNFAGQYGAKSIKLAVMMGFITEEQGEEIREARRWNDGRLGVVKQIEDAYDKMMPERNFLLDYAAHLAKPECDKYCKKTDKFHQRSPHRGYVRTLLGRRSRFPTNYKTYIGLNRILQGTGADIMKQKLIELFAERKRTGFVMRLTVHDAAGGDARNPDTLRMVSEILNHQSFPLSVPIKWTAKTGRNWAEAK